MVCYTLFDSWNYPHLESISKLYGKEFSPHPYRSEDCSHSVSPGGYSVPSAMRTYKPWGPEGTAPWNWKQHVQKQGQQWPPWADLLDSNFSKEACAELQKHTWAQVSLPQRLLQTVEKRSEGKYLGSVGWQASRWAEYELQMTTAAKTGIQVPRKDSNWFSLDRSHLWTTWLGGREWLRCMNVAAWSYAVAHVDERNRGRT